MTCLWSPELTWWRERTDFHKSSSDLPCECYYTHPDTHTQDKLMSRKSKWELYVFRKMSVMWNLILHKQCSVPYLHARADCDFPSTRQQAKAGFPPLVYVYKNLVTKFPLSNCLQEKWIQYLTLSPFSTAYGLTRKICIVTLIKWRIYML